MCLTTSDGRPACRRPTALRCWPPVAGCSRCPAPIRKDRWPGPWTSWAPRWAPVTVSPSSWTRRPHLGALRDAAATSRDRRGRLLLRVARRGNDAERRPAARVRRRRPLVPHRVLPPGRSGAHVPRRPRQRGAADRRSLRAAQVEPPAAGVFRAGPDTPMVTIEVPTQRRVGHRELPSRSGIRAGARSPAHSHGDQR